MAMQSSRRGFLKGDFRVADPEAMRPPGAVAEFAQLCDRCTKCAEACPEAIITRDSGGWPVVDFALGACTFCGDCATACPSGALLSTQVQAWPWVANINAACLSMQGITCRACEDACDARAIRFRLETGGKSRPILDFGQCTGCGACEFSCPEQAVDFNRRDISITETAQ